MVAATSAAREPISGRTHQCVASTTRLDSPAFMMNAAVASASVSRYTSEMRNGNAGGQRSVASPKIW